MRLASSERFQDVIELRGGIMKWHRFFAWASTICMALALYTGYKHK